MGKNALDKMMKKSSTSTKNDMKIKKIKFFGTIKIIEK